METLKSVYGVVLGFYRRDGRIPSARELMREKGWKSPYAASYWLDKMVDVGLLGRGPTGYVLVADPKCPWCGKLLDRGEDGLAKQ